VVAAAVTDNASDQGQLVPMVDAVAQISQSVAIASDQPTPPEPVERVVVQRYHP